MTEQVIQRVKTTTSSYQGVIRYILGLQHLIAMFGATVLVPMLTGLSPTVSLLAAGVGTLIFHFCTKWKVPVFLGSSFAFIPVILQVKEMYQGDLAYAQGGIVVAGFVYLIFSFLVNKIGVEKIDRYLPPQVVGPMIIVIGLNLIPTAFNMASGNFLIAGITLATFLVIKTMTKGFISQLSILLAVIVGYIVSFSSGLVQTEVITSAPMLTMPNVTLPKFDLPAIMVIVPIIIAVFMEHLGDIKTNSQVVGKNFVKDPGLNRTIMGDGLATMFAGFIGGPANTTYGENTAVLAITKNYDPSLIRLAAFYAIGLSFIGKLGALIHSIPVFVMGGISIVLFSMIALVGVKTIKTNQVKMNVKNILVMGSILVIGFGSPYIQQAFGITIGIEALSLTGLSFAAIVGIALNTIFMMTEKEK